jgi:hypothetical protein
MDTETVEVPFQMLGNRQVLTEKQAVELPWVGQFIASFPACFEYDLIRNIWVLTK